MSFSLTRRAAIRLLGTGAAALYLDLLPSAFAASSRRPDLDFGPIARDLDEPALLRFSGDEPEPAHRILRERDAFLASLGQLPPPEERVALAIVGGGMAGLTAAYRLRRHQPVLLEQAARFGGNSKGESWRGIDYATGAAYFVAPEAGTPLARLYRELGVDKLWRRKPAGHPVALAGKRYADFWAGTTAPKNRAPFRALRRYLRAILAGDYPEIPALSAGQRRRVDDLDRGALAAHLRSVLGGPLHPHLATAVEHYCWSSFGAPASEVSAAAGLNFLAAEFGDIVATPGGNAAVAERLVERLAAALPPEHLRAGATVFRVRETADGVELSYADGQGAVRTLHAQAVVLACPKFVCAKILEGIEPERLAAIGRLRYRAYLVANVLLERPLRPDFYDLYLLGEGRGKFGDLPASAARQGATDIVLGTYARPSRRGAVLTLYRPLPFDAGRAELFAEGAYGKYRAEFERQIAADILPLLGLKPEDVAELRLARWGHPLPVAATGLIAEGVTDRLRRPFGRRIFFAQQDNWALPALETAATEALLWAPEVERLLR